MNMKHITTILLVVYFGSKNAIMHERRLDRQRAQSAPFGQVKMFFLLVSILFF